MGFKNKCVLSVHNYSRELFVTHVRNQLNLFIKLLILRHPESPRTMRPRTEEMMKRRPQWQLPRWQLLYRWSVGPPMRLFLPVKPLRVIINLHFPYYLLFAQYRAMRNTKGMTRHLRGEPPLELRPARRSWVARLSPPRWRVARLRYKTRIVVQLFWSTLSKLHHRTMTKSWPPPTTGRSCRGTPNK